MALHWARRLHAQEPLPEEAGAVVGLGVAPYRGPRDNLWQVLLERYLKRYDLPLA
jgi:hypothetical protein